MATDVVYARCTKCGDMFPVDGEHYCVPQIQDIIHRATAKFRQPRKPGERKCRSVREIEGGIELAWHRGFAAGVKSVEKSEDGDSTI